MSVSLREEVGSPFVRVVRYAVAFVAVGALIPAVASAELVVNDDTVGPGPNGADCATPDHSTIEAAIDAASAGETILVCEGTYTEPDGQVLIDRSVELIGNGPGSSIIDGEQKTGLPLAGLVRTIDSVNHGLLMRGFTLREAGQVGVSPTASRFGIAVLGADPGTTLEFADLEIEGLGEGGRDFGFYVQNAMNDVVLRESTVSGTDSNPVLVSGASGAVTIADNAISSDPTTPSTPVFAAAISNQDVNGTWRISRNRIDANGASGIAVQTGLGTPPARLGPVELEGNVVEEYGALGIAVTNTSSAPDGLDGEISEVSIEGNGLAPKQEATGTGVRLRGLISGAEIVGNDVRGAETGIAVEPFAAGHEPTAVSANLNRITGNATGLRNETAGSVDATDNWWGCNGGPGEGGCDSVDDAAAGVTAFDPWIVLGLTSNPSELVVGGETSDLAISLRENSAGQVPANVESLPGEFDVDLSTTLGSVAPQTLTLDDQLTGAGTLTSGDEAGTAAVTARLDNAVATTQVEFTRTRPGPGPAKLGLELTPKRKKVGRGRHLMVTVNVINTGESAAQNARICMKVPKRKLRPKGKRCRPLGSLAAGNEATKRFRVRAKKRAPGRKAKIRFVATADNTAAVRAKVGIRIKRKRKN